MESMKLLSSHPTSRSGRHPLISNRASRLAPGPIARLTLWHHWTMAGRPGHFARP